MPRFTMSLPVLAVALAFSVQAQAGTLTRTFVSSTGVDTNPCTVTQPCASFAAAYALVAPNGIVAALDPGKYGPLNITTPVTIDGNGWAAITSPANGAGITVAAGTTANVVLRGITVDGAEDTGTYGIQYTSGASLAIDGCVVRNMFSGGFQLGNSASAARNLTVTNSSLQNDNTAVLVDPSGSGAVSVAFDAVQLTGNSTNGLLVTSSSGTGAINVAVTNSVISNNAGNGIYALSTAAATNIYLTHVQVTNNATSGVQSSGVAATIWLGQTTITENPSLGYDANSNGTINSFDDNYIADNGSNLGTLGTAGKQ
jgi:Right handed beta helix region